MSDAGVLSAAESVRLLAPPARRSDDYDSLRFEREDDVAEPSVAKKKGTISLPPLTFACLVGGSFLLGLYAATTAGVRPDDARLSSAAGGVVLREGRSPSFSIDAFGVPRETNASFQAAIEGNAVELVANSVAANDRDRPEQRRRRHDRRHHHHQKNDRLLYLNHPEAYRHLLNFHGDRPFYSNDYFLLESGLDAQINQKYCAVTTAASILNSLRFLRSGGGKSTSEEAEEKEEEKGEVAGGVDLGIDVAYDPYVYATQRDVLLGECVHRNVVSSSGDRDGIMTYPYGLGMDQFGSLLRCHLDVDDNWTVTVRRVDDDDSLSPNVMRDEMKKALLDPTTRIAVNYDRSGIGQIGGGHWSPVGSYDPSIDSFLIVDVAKYKYPPVWVPAEKLYESLVSYDDCGSWDYPEGQDSLPESLWEPRKGTEAEDEAKVILGCASRSRGYVIVQRS